MIDLRAPEGRAGGNLSADAADTQAEALGDERVRELQRVELLLALRGLDDDAEGVGAVDRDALAGAAAARAEALGLRAGRHGGRVAVLGEIVELAARADDAEIARRRSRQRRPANAASAISARKRRDRDSDSHL